MSVMKKAAIWLVALVLSVATFSGIVRSLSVQNLLLAGRPVVEVRVHVAG
jgi:hypothetical protein